MGFFAESEVRNQPPPSNLPRCGQCGLNKKCLTPEMPVSGLGWRKVLVVAEAPGQDEDNRGTQLVGKAGQKLRDELESIGVDLDKDCWKTNAVICRPPDNKMEERYIQSCRPNLNRTIKELKPEVVVLLGGSAVKCLIGQDWTKDIGALERWVGWTIPSRRLNTWICPTYHPSYLVREKNPVLDLWTRRHLKAAFSKSGRPYRTMPNMAERVRVEVSPAEAAKYLEQRLESLDKDQYIAFDYETNMLKPDSSEAAIWSCSVCFGDETIAYPWHGRAVWLTKALLMSPNPKIGANIKFEQRWTKKAFGRGVKNWAWDTMQDAHILDNRPGISSVKFQAFVRLGVSPWDENITPFLRSKNTSHGLNSVNRISEISIRDLLYYNALDSQTEYELAMLQMKDMGAG